MLVLFILWIHCCPPLPPPHVSHLMGPPQQRLRAKSSKSYHLGQKMNFIKLFGVLYGWKAYTL